MHVLPVLAALLLGAPTPTPQSDAEQPPASRDLAAEAEPITEADVRPYFEGPLAAAIAAYEAHNYLESAAQFEKSPKTEARLLRGFALAHAEQGTEPAELLAGMELAFPVIADRILYWRGKAWDAAGDREEAARAYARIPAGSLLWADAQLSRAKDFDALGKTELALGALAPLLAIPQPKDLAQVDQAASALLLAGRIHAQGHGEGDPAWSRRAYLECWAGHPLAPEAGECLAALAKLPKPLSGPPGNEEVLRHAESLLEQNRNQPALKDLTALVPNLPEAAPSQPMACRARFALGKAYRKERHQALAMEMLRPVVERCDDPALQVKALYVLASAASIVAPAEGIDLYEKLARDFPAHSYADDALFFESDLLARTGRLDQAKKKLSDLVEHYPQGDYRAEALFRIAWYSRASNDLAAAIAVLSRMEEEYQSSDPYEWGRAAYWRARLLADRGGKGDLDTARKVWSQVLERFPVDYYGLLARARLSEHQAASDLDLAALTAAPESSGFVYAAGWLAGDPHFRAGILLLRLGMSKAAADELNAAAAHKPATGEVTEQIFLLGELLDRAGDHRNAHYLIRTAGRSFMRERPDLSTLRLWRVAYPPAFRELVKRWAPRANVPVDLLQAVMREESAFDPLCVSTAGAVGLTQLMPSGAQALAKKYKLRKPSQADLLTPEINVRIGAIELGEYLKQYDGSPALALAAYNAGTRPVGAWLNVRGQVPLDEFVEEIPIQETRIYVKRVLRSYGTYRFLYGKPGEGMLVLNQKLPLRK